MGSYETGDIPVPDYQIDSFLGEGGYGRVYRVASVKTGYSKALKVIILKNTKGVEEYNALELFREIHHPHLLPIMDFWLKDEEGKEIKYDENESLHLAQRGKVELLILMGLAERSLADLLKDYINKTGKGIPLEELMDYMNQVIKAIDFLNQPKTIGARKNVAIQHGDIKPGNMMIVGGGIQLGDYGLAQAITVTTRKPKVTPGSIAGTPEYASPEQVGSMTSQWSDQYSLAISYYELRTGKLPFDQQAYRFVCVAAAIAGLDFSLVPAAEQEVLKRAAHAEYDKRFPTCMDFFQALKDVHLNGVIRPDKPPPPPQISKPAKRASPAKMHWIAWLLLIVLAIWMIAITIYVLRR